MAHLDLSGVSADGRRLLLVSRQGEEFTLDINPALRAALRGETTRIGQLEIQMDSTLRPRDIQARIRAGETPESVAQAAHTTVEKILPFFRTSLGVEDKGSAAGFDPVTAADRAAEVTMRTLIKRNFPEHGIVGEEYGNERTEAEYVWVLDPIDGTKSFISGMPTWG